MHLHGFASQMGHAVQEIHTVDSNHYATEPNQQQSRNHAYDVLPPGVEPPPPGFENEVCIQLIYCFLLDMHNIPIANDD